MLADLRTRCFTNHFLHNGTLVCKLWVANEEPQCVRDEIHRLRTQGLMS